MRRPQLKTALAILWLTALSLAPVLSMTQSQIPPKFNIPWASSAVAPYIRSIPQASQIGIQNCAASLTDGFPPNTFVPAAQGGCPPFGADFNGALKQITQWSQWQAAGGPVFYDSALSTSIGGYPTGAVVQSTVLRGRLWFSQADNNTTNPDLPSAANWTVLPGTNAPGTVIPSMSTTPPPNTVSANGHTVGNASSNASGRANADTYWLFVFIWTNCQDTTQCPMFNSSGFTVARGSSAGADFAANNAIATMNMSGSGLVGADSQGGVTTNYLVGVPVSTGNRIQPTSIVGENLHQLTAGESPTITSVTNNTFPQSLSVSVSTTTTSNQIVTAPGGFVDSTTGGGSAGFFRAFPTGNAQEGTAASTGTGTGTTTIPQIPATSNNTGNGSHNTVMRTLITYWYLAL